MALRLLQECSFNGPALPEPFVEFELERELNRLDLLPKTTSEEGRALGAFWTIYRRRLRELGGSDGALRIRRSVIEPLMELLGFTGSEDPGKVTTREGDEDGGWLLTNSDGARLRVWTASFDEDLDAPVRRGAAYRFSRLQIANRVLFASGERIGILCNGAEIRILISDPARRASEIVIHIDPEWKRSPQVPDAFRFLLAIAQPRGLAALPDILEKARLQQVRVTTDLRKQAREAVEKFAAEVLIHPANRERLAVLTDRAQLARDLWHEGLILIYRLLFLLKMESTDDPARSFRFASSTLWRNTFSPRQALHPRARDVLESGTDTGTFLEDGLRQLFRMFAEGLEASELHVAPLGGMLFGEDAAPLLRQLAWGERAVAFLLDRLLLTRGRDGERRYVHYGSLSLEDLGRVYEALLELEPGIASEPLCRLRRQKLEVVVPAAQGERYRDSGTDDAEDDADEPRGPTKIEWIESIAPNRFYLRVGLGRKSSGSYYTPERFVRFLVEQTLGPVLDKCSPRNDPNPAAVLKLKVVDPAMGSGHFLVDACRFLGARLYEACRACDLRVAPAERRAEAAIDDDVRAAAIAEAAKYRGRLTAVSGPDGELLSYLPSRVVEGSESGVSQQRAEALCRRLVAVHCLYGVDKNVLAVELAKLTVWIEAHAEGLPLTFLDHRLVMGDSLTGPFFEHLLTYPSDRAKLEGLFADGLRQRFREALTEALVLVKELEADIGASLSELKKKEALKRKLDAALAPFRAVAASWAGRVMSGQGTGSDYLAIVQQALAGNVPDDELADPGALPFDLAFPEVFFPTGDGSQRGGFDVVLGNPPWEGLDTSDNEFFASFDFSILELKTDGDRKALINSLLTDPRIATLRSVYEDGVDRYKRASTAYFRFVNLTAEGSSAATPDVYQCFAERSVSVAVKGGYIGVVLPSAFHSNDGASGIRRLYLDNTKLLFCFSFENRRKLFEIDSRFKFALVVAVTGAPTGEFPCCFYLHDDMWLFEEQRNPEPLVYTKTFLLATTGSSLAFLELRRPSDTPPALQCYRSAKERFGELRRRLQVLPTEELHASKQKWRLVLTSEILTAPSTDPRDPEVAEELICRGILPWHEGKTVHQFTDIWGERPEYCVPVRNMAGKEARLSAARYFRLGFRSIARSNDERSAIFAVLPPGVITSHSLLVESCPEKRPYVDALALCALANSFTFDWLLRLAVSANITFNFLDPQPVPDTSSVDGFLAHSVLRLTCNHSGYAPLWQNQVGSNWRESKPDLGWPVLPAGPARTELRAALDSVIAQLYGLSRDSFAYILAAFDHASNPDTPILCLDKFDEFATLGVTAFTRKYDPYWDVPLVESLPRPVIELPGVEVEAEEFTLQAPPAAPTRRRGRRS